MRVTIRPAKPNDAPAMAEIHAKSWEAAYRDILPTDYIKTTNAARRKAFKINFINGTITHYVIEADGKPVGVLCIAPPQGEHDEMKGESGTSERCLELHYIYLHPAYFRMGIGTKAMEYALALAKSAGKTEMIVWVFAENTNAVQFYKTCGFAFDGMVKYRDYGKTMRCIRMQRKI